MKGTGTNPHSLWHAVKSDFSGVSQMTRTGLFSAPTVLRKTSEAHLYDRLQIWFSEGIFYPLFDSHPDFAPGIALGRVSSLFHLSMPQENTKAKNKGTGCYQALDPAAPFTREYIR
jgi:hypothetical protein